MPAPLPESERSDFNKVREHRAAHLRKQRHLYPIPGPIPEVVETMRKIPMRDGYEIDIKLYNPKNPPKDGSPLIVMYHEGGWSMGDLTDEDLNCRMFARDLGAVCLNIDYRYSISPYCSLAVHKLTMGSKTGTGVPVPNPFE